MTARPPTRSMRITGPGLTEPAYLRWERLDGNWFWVHQSQNLRQFGLAGPDPYGDTAPAFRRMAKHNGLSWEWLPAGADDFLPHVNNQQSEELALNRTDGRTDASKQKPKRAAKRTSKAQKPLDPSRHQPASATPRVSKTEVSGQRESAPTKHRILTCS